VRVNDDRSRWEARYAAHANDRSEAPSRFLEQHIDSIPRGAALDLACGAGRHAIYLAAHGFTVDAIDIAGAGLRRAQRTARSQGLPVRFVQADLDHFPLPPDRYALTVSTRFLNRTLWPALKRCTRPLGMVLYETFTIDQPSIGHPSNPAYLLAHDELRRAFADFDVLAYEEGRFETETGAAFLAQLLARRPSAWRPR
jgi:SAM-dependent methyltransferase